MADQDDSDVVDWDAGYSLGAKVVEMCDRVKIAHSYLPGAVAKTSIQIDGVQFDVAVSVSAARPSATSEAD